MGNILRVKFGTSRSVNADPLWQYDYGQVLKLEGITLPIAYEVHFAKFGDATSVTQVGDADGVDIPDAYLQTPGEVRAWLYLHTGDTDGETEYQVSIPVQPRAQPTNDEPTPVQQDAITEALAALSAGVSAAEDAQEAAEAAQEAIEDMSVSASTLPAGSSASVTKSIDPDTGAVELAFGIPKGDTGAAGADGQDGAPGADGSDGVSPTISVADITGGHRITITDAGGDHTFDVMDGADGNVVDVKVGGTSVVSNGVANVPIAGQSLGVVKINYLNGIGVVDANGTLGTSPADSNDIKVGTNGRRPIVPVRQDESTFYGLAKAAGNTDQASSSNAVGSYTEDAKSKISDMLNGAVAVTGSTPSITAKPGIRYECGECSTLAIALPASGDVEVIFESGSTATVLTVTPPTGVTSVKWPDWFDPDDLDADVVYDIIVTNGEFGVVTQWAT